ncbi:putative protein OS=Streptomyces rimosus subsp. rimosus (strain ATCC / DSM 40260 / JCM 4667 / NRRL 2234) OX=1265868 GN=SRIM_040615 PE=4 SV=1 [Streptomyces rimosus subsp. rimosus]
MRANCRSSDGCLPRLAPIVSARSYRREDGSFWAEGGTRWQIELDLTREDLGWESRPGLWDLLYQTDRLYADRGVPVPERGLQCGGVCRDAGVVAWMYLRERNGRREAVHERSEDEARHQAVLSDEHKAYQERIVRVSVADGHRADSEVRTPVGPRSWIQTDTLVQGAGGIRIGWEIQLSSAGREGPRSVKARARKAAEYGITPAWHTDRSDYATRSDTHWTRSDNLPAEVIAKTGDLRVVSGFRALDFWRCDVRALYPCPDTSHRCGKRHVTPKPKDVLFDDLVRKTAAGLIVPVEHQLGSKAHRFWVTDADRDRLEDHNAGRPVLPAVEPEDERELPHRASYRPPTCRPSVPPAAPPAGAPSVGPPMVPPSPPTPPSSPARPVGAWPSLSPAPVRQAAPHPPSPAVKPAVPRQPGPGDRMVKRLLDWRSGEHWSAEPRPCRYCSRATNLRDEDGVPSHKTCAETQGAGRRSV